MCLDPTNMPQFGLLMMLISLPLQLLSGGVTPREIIPKLVQNSMLVAPTTHFVSAGQAILFRGAGFEVVWPQFLAFCNWLGSSGDKPEDHAGGQCFAISLRRLRGTIGQVA